MKTEESSRNISLHQLIILSIRIFRTIFEECLIYGSYEKLINFASFSNRIKRTLCPIDDALRVLPALTLLILELLLLDTHCLLSLYVRAVFGYNNDSCL